MTSSKRAALALAAAASLTFATPARAQPHTPTAQELETARDLYKEGKELRAQGDLKGAIDKLQAAHALGHTPVTGIELARTYVMVGKFVEAREIALSIARMPIAGDETDRSADARVEAAKLADEVRPKIATLLVTGKGVGPKEPVHVTIDGAPVPDAAVREPQKVNPGKHEVVLSAGDGPTLREARASAELAEAQTVEVVVEIPPAPMVLAPEHPVGAPESPPPEKPGMPLLAKVGFGIGIAGVAVGTFSGAAALILKGRLSGECVAKSCDNSRGGASDLNSAESWATASTIAFIAAGGGAALGLLELLSASSPSRAPSASIAPWIGPTGAGVHGRF